MAKKCYPRFHNYILSPLPLSIPPLSLDFSYLIYSTYLSWDYVDDATSLLKYIVLLQHCLMYRIIFRHISVMRSISIKKKLITKNNSSVYSVYSYTSETAFFILENTFPKLVIYFRDPLYINEYYRLFLDVAAVEFGSVGHCSRS